MLLIRKLDKETTRTGGNKASIFRMISQIWWKVNRKKIIFSKFSNFFKIGFI